MTIKETQFFFKYLICLIWDMFKDSKFFLNILIERDLELSFNFKFAYFTLFSYEIKT